MLFFIKKRGWVHYFALLQSIVAVTYSGFLGKKLQHIGYPFFNLSIVSIFFIDFEFKRKKMKKFDKILKKKTLNEKRMLKCRYI